MGGQFHGFEGEVEVADDGVVEFLVSGAVEADVVGGPAGAEILAAGGEFADQFDELLVVGLRPASERSMAAMSSAERFQSVKKSWLAGSR